MKRKRDQTNNGCDGGKLVKATKVRFEMKSEKKCPECGQWTDWEKKLDDACSHCGKLLQPQAIKEKAEREVREQIVASNDFFRIRPEDGLAMKAVRRTAWVGHLIYAAIVWFFLVTFASTPG